MTETANLKLPLLQPAQAQKHVTVNEALVRLDGLAQLSLGSITLTDPPAVEEGACYGVPMGATGDWAGQEGQLALGSNGGWIFLTPHEGWTAWVQDTAQLVAWHGGWSLRPLAAGPSGAAVRLHMEETEVDLAAGGAQDLTAILPNHTMVCAVSSRVILEIAGSLSSWELGTAGAENRFGSGMGTGAGSYSYGILGTPTTFYADTPLRFTPLGGTVSTGRLRLAISYFAFALPGA